MMTVIKMMTTTGWDAAAVAGVTHALTSLTAVAVEETKDAVLASSTGRSRRNLTSVPVSLSSVAVYTHIEHFLIS